MSDPQHAPGASYAPIADDAFAWLGRDPIPTAAYRDPDYFALEREAVFKRTWLQIGHVCELPGSGSFIVRPVEVANASVLIVRDRDGRIRAFHNVCTHRGTELVAESCGRRASFSCRYHCWTFGHDGRLMSAPDFERFYVDRDSCSLRPVTVDVCGGLIFINFEREPAQGLREFLDAFAGQLDGLAIRRATDFTEYHYEIDANWKVNYDNFQENYHLRFIHPRTGAAAAGPDNPFGYPTRYDFHGPHRSQTLWKNPALPELTPVLSAALRTAAESAALEDAGHPARTKVDCKIFPNLFVIGQSSYIFTHCVMPLTVNRSRGVIRIYWNGADRSASQRFAREFVMGTLRDVHAEDRGIITAGQRGLDSGALATINFQTHEVLCRHLYKSVDVLVEAFRTRAAPPVAQA
jgi:phenylpropionate dioxygenase-like ring-hydroxylating dioxygenase large terminal subunit